MTSAPLYPPAPPKVHLEQQENCTTKSALLPTFFPAVEVAEDKSQPLRWRPVNRLNRWRYWVPNAHQTIWVLLVDVDRLDALLHVLAVLKDSPELPPPSWIIENDTGHCHLAWIIEPVATGPRARRKPQAYAHAVARSLSEAFGGDPAFVRGPSWATHRSLNPFWTGWEKNRHGMVIWRPDRSPRSLGSLQSSLEAAGAWVRTPRSAERYSPSASDPADPSTAAGRNCWVFDRTRLRTSGTPWQAAHAANDQLPFPMSAAEVDGIARSVEGWEARRGRSSGPGGTMSDQERAAQAARGRKGGAADTAAQRAARAQGPAAAAVVRSAEAVGREAQIKALHASGMTRAQIMASTGYGRTLVYRVLRGL